MVASTVHAHGNRLAFSVQCPLCGQHSTVSVLPEQYMAWRYGELIQNAMPDLTADERELFQTGICKKCWPTS